MSNNRVSKTKGNNLSIICKNRINSYFFKKTLRLSKGHKKLSGCRKVNNYFSELMVGTLHRAWNNDLLFQQQGVTYLLKYKDFQFDNILMTPGHGPTFHITEPFSRGFSSKGARYVEDWCFFLLLDCTSCWTNNHISGDLRQYAHVTSLWCIVLWCI